MKWLDRVLARLLQGVLEKQDAILKGQAETNRLLRALGEATVDSAKLAELRVEIEALRKPTADVAGALRDNP